MKALESPTFEKWNSRPRKWRLLNSGILAVWSIVSDLRMNEYRTSESSSESDQITCRSS